MARPCLKPLASGALAALLLGLLGLAALAPASARAFCQTTTKTKLTGSECITDGIPLSWNRQCITFTVESDDAAVRDAVDRSFATWSAVHCDGHPIGLSVRQTEETARCTLAEYNADAPNMNAILFVKDWADHAELPADAFAVTLVWNLKQDGEIVDADMLLNPTLGNLTICGDQCADAENDIDIQNVVTHEAGHFLGLAHANVEGATMSPTAPVGQVEKRDLADDDIEGLCSIYGKLPVADCSNKAFVPRHGFSVDCRQPPSSKGGCAVSAVSAASAASAERSSNGAWLAFGTLSVALLVRRRRR